MSQLVSIYRFYVTTANDIKHVMRTVTVNVLSYFLAQDKESQFNMTLTKEFLLVHVNVLPKGTQSTYIAVTL